MTSLYEAWLLHPIAWSYVAWYLLTRGVLLGFVSRWVLELRADWLEEEEPRGGPPSLFARGSEVFHVVWIPVVPEVLLLVVLCAEFARAVWTIATEGLLTAMAKLLLWFRRQVNSL